MNIFNLFISGIYSIWFNFRYLPLKQAIKIPLLINTCVYIRKLKKGQIILLSEQMHFAMSKIGFHKVPALDEKRVHTIINVSGKGKIYIKEDIHIGKGAIIHCENGILTLGSNFAISGSTSIICYKSITIGDNVQFSWDTLVIDSDTHSIYAVDGTNINEDRDIYIGNNVWIGCKNTILKGTTINSNCVIGAGSLLCKNYKEGQTIIAGNPAKEIKSIKNWSI